jgi:dsRNA-specific ribonuclease
MYMTDEEYQEYLAFQNSPSKTGIGVNTLYDSNIDGVYVVSVYNNSPAASAGIVPGDVIVKVDGREVSEMGFYTAMSVIGMGEEKTGGREKDAIIADMFEAFLGALFLDQGWPAVDSILNETLLTYLDHPEDVAEIDYKTRLQEYVQADSRRTVHYELVDETGPSNAPEFTMNAVVDGLIMGTGKGSSKKQAEQNAARNAFEKMAR